MEIVITIMLLLVPILSLVALLLSIRAYRRSSALKGLVIGLAQVKQQTPEEKAVEAFRIADM